MTERLRPMIAVDEVTYRYGRTGPAVLDHVSLDLPVGQVVGVAGRNGSGKTTLARLLNGLLRPTAGTVHVDGLDTARTSVQSLAAHVGLAFQNPNHQLFAPTVAAELAFGPRNLGVGETEIAERVADAAARLGLTGVLDRHPYHLERGARKLVAIASVVTMRTPILVLDEPTTGQDRRTSTVVARLDRRPARRRHDDRVRVARHAAPGRRRGPPRRAGRGLASSPTGRSAPSCPTPAP